MVFLLWVCHFLSGSLITKFTNKIVIKSITSSRNGKREKRALISEHVGISSEMNTNENF